MSDGLVAALVEIAVEVETPEDPVFVGLDGVVDGFTLRGSAGEDDGAIITQRVKISWVQLRRNECWRSQESKTCFSGEVIT